MSRPVRTPKATPRGGTGSNDVAVALRDNRGDVEVPLRGRARGRGRGGTNARLQLRVVQPEDQNTVGAPVAYGDIVDSDYVHDEIRDVGDQIKKVIKENFQRHGTSEKQVLDGIRQFGPSKQSKKILNKENDAARIAYEKGIYVVWRLMEKPRLRGANNDFCCRVGGRHRCFCGHAFSRHRLPNFGRGGALPQQNPCEECGCKSFKYVPNEPEEIGEGWLTRRTNWDPAKWSAKCRCDHGHLDHDPVTLSCRACGCCGFNSHFLCVVCDMPWEAHMTVYETESERHRAGNPVRQDYFPLSNIDWDVRELVLTDVTGGGALEPPPGYETRRLSEGPKSARSRGRGRGRGGPSPRVEEMFDDKPVGGAAASYLTADYCPSCATIYKDDADTCGRCGRLRPGRH